MTVKKTKTDDQPNNKPDIDCQNKKNEDMPDAINSRSLSNDRQKRKNYLSNDEWREAPIHTDRREKVCR